MLPTDRQVAGYLNRLLRTREIPDASVNGLQARSRRKAIRTVGFAVDGCVSTFRLARDHKVDLLVVHHGISWRPQKDRASAALRKAWLAKAGMGLYAAHLPLDLHARYGNNAELCRLLGLEDLKKFGRYHGIKIGYQGRLPMKRAPQDIARQLDRALRTRCRVLPFGKGTLSSLGIISGGGGGLLAEAVREGLDGFVVGEIDLAVYNAAREQGMNVIAAGHYATETAGVQALMPVIAERFGVRTVFIDDPKDL